MWNIQRDTSSLKKNPFKSYFLKEVRRTNVQNTEETVVGENVMRLLTSDRGSVLTS